MNTTPAARMRSSVASNSSTEKNPTFPEMLAHRRCLRVAVCLSEEQAGALLEAVPPPIVSADRRW